MKIKLKGIITSRSQFTSKELNNLRVDMSAHRVWLNNQALDWKKSLTIRNHSPDGPNWGYGGSGPSQFALAVCLEIFGKARAEKVYQDFKRQYIASLPIDNDFQVELDLSAFILEHQEEFQLADLEEKEQLLNDEEIKRLQEQDRKHPEMHPEDFLSTSLKKSVEKSPDLLERFCQMSPLPFTYAGFGGCKSICHLIVSKRNNIVIASEAEENPGTSITNVASSLANEVCAAFNLNKNKLIWIEHYSTKSYTGGMDDETFSLVSFSIGKQGKFMNAAFSHLSLAEVTEFLVLLD